MQVVHVFRINSAYNVADAPRRRKKRKSELIWCFSSFELGALNFFLFDFIDQLQRLGERADLLNDLIQFAK